MVDPPGIAGTGTIMGKLLKFLLVTAFLIATFVVTFAASEKTLVIGTTDSYQQQILGRILGIYLEEQGFEIAYKSSISHTNLHRLLSNKNVDLIWEDPAVAWFLKFLQAETLPSEELYKKVKKMDEEEGIVWTRQSNLARGYALFMKQDRAEELNLNTISDLAKYVNENPRKIKMAMDDEFFFRPDCHNLVKDVYDFSLSRGNLKMISSGGGFAMLSAGQVDVTAAIFTDPLTDRSGIKKLIVDKKALIYYHLGIALHKETIRQFANILDLIDPLLKKSPSDQEMAELNLAVYNGQSPEETAYDYLKEKLLMKLTRGRIKEID